MLYKFDFGSIPTKYKSYPREYKVTEYFGPRYFIWITIDKSQIYFYFNKGIML